MQTKSAQKESETTENEIAASLTIPKEFTRFKRIQITEHWIVMILFIALVATGLPQSYPASRISQVIVSLFGGIDLTRFIHRTVGILFAIVAAWHLGRAVWNTAIRKRKPEMLPTSRDFHDAVNTLRFYLKRTNEYPQFGRFDFRQKFEYMGMLMGSLVMIGTGLLLMFPVFFTHVLPAVLIPVAKITHSYEALLALSVILIWHIYGAHLSPEVFPVDKSIFTGKISLERMEKEHPLELKKILSAEAPIKKPNEEEGLK